MTTLAGNSYSTALSRSSAEARAAYLERIRANTGRPKTEAVPGVKNNAEPRFDGKSLTKGEQAAVAAYLKFLRTDDGKDQAKHFKINDRDPGYREDGGSGSSKDARARYLARLNSNGGRGAK